jgi:hypothetical protein
MRICNRLLIFLSTIFLSLTLDAQNASVTGEIVDPQHAGIKGSVVTLTNINTHVKMVTRSNGNGAFLLPPVAPGNYEIKAEADGLVPLCFPGSCLRWVSPKC